MRYYVPAEEQYLEKKNQIFDFLVIHSTYIIPFINISLEILFNLGCLYLIAYKRTYIKLSHFRNEVLFSSLFFSVSNFEKNIR